MSDSDPSLPSREEARNAQFLTTRWSVVLGAADSSGPEMQGRALESLCRDYWYPLYAYLRRSGKSQADAEDLVQGFFQRFLQRKDFKHATPDRGRFRSYLLKSLKNYAANEWEKANAAKRGGGLIRFSMDEDYEGRYEREPADLATPDSLYDKSWASSLLDKVLNKLAGEFAASGKEKLFRSLRGHLAGHGRQGGATEYSEIAEQHGMTTPAVTMAVRRMRQRYGELLRREIAGTVASVEDVEEEIRFLLQALAA